MSKKKTIILIIILLLLALVAGGSLYFLTKNKVNNKQETPVAETPAAETPDVEQFDGKQYNITSENNKIQGYATIVIDESEEHMKVKVGYFLKIKDNFAKTSIAGVSSDYNLLGNLQTFEQTRNGNGTGAVGSILCEKDAWPDMREMIIGDSYEETKMYFDCTWNDINMLGADTNVFYHHLSRFYQPQDFNLEDVISLNKLEIYEASPFYFTNTTEDGTEYYDYSEEEVVQSGDIVGSYILKYE